MRNLLCDEFGFVFKLVCRNDSVDQSLLFGFGGTQGLGEIEVLIGAMEVHHHPGLDHGFAAREPHTLGKGHLEIRVIRRHDDVV